MSKLHYIIILFLIVGPSNLIAQDSMIYNIIDEVWFVTDVDDCMQNVNDIFKAREEIYGCKPEVTQTLVGVTALVDPALKIEIKCTAYLD